MWPVGTGNEGVRADRAHGRSRRSTLRRHAFGSWLATQLEAAGPVDAVPPSRDRGIMALAVLVLGHGVCGLCWQLRAVILGTPFDTWLLAGASYAAPGVSTLATSAAALWCGRAIVLMSARVRVAAMIYALFAVATAVWNVVLAFDGFAPASRPAIGRGVILFDAFAAVAGIGLAVATAALCHRRPAPVELTADVFS